MTIQFTKVARLARERIEPVVKEMEAKGDILPEIRDLMFQSGVSFSMKHIRQTTKKNTNKNDTFWQKMIRSLTGKYKLK